MLLNLSIFTFFFYQKLSLLNLVNLLMLIYFYIYELYTDINFITKNESIFKQPWLYQHDNIIIIIKYYQIYITMMLAKLVCVYYYLYYNIGYLSRRRLQCMRTLFDTEIKTVDRGLYIYMGANLCTYSLFLGT